MNGAALQSYLNLGAVDHLNVLHHAHKSNLVIVINSANGWHESTYTKQKAIIHAAQLEAARVSDCYIGQNPIQYGKGRAFSNVSCLANCFVDLDVYNVPELSGMDKHDILQRILSENPNMPRPTMFADSGRGMYLVWTFTTTKPVSFKPAWQVIENNLVELLTPYGADPKCRDVARVLRLSATENSKSLTLADYEQIGEPIRFEDLQKFSNALTKEKKAQQRQATNKKPATVTKLRTSFAASNAFTLAYSRMQDIRKLAELRGGRLTDCRKTALYAYGMAAAWYCPTVQSLEAELTAFIDDCLAAPSDYYKRMPTTVIQRKQQSLDGVTVTWEGKQCDARYRVRNSTLIRLLNITEAEQRQLTCIISQAEKRRRKVEQQTAKRRRSGIVARHEYEQQAHSRRQQALNLRTDGMTQVAIAKALGVSQRAVSGYLKGVAG